MRKTLATICLVVVITFLFPNFTTSHYIFKAEAPAPQRTWEDYSVVEIINYYSILYLQDPALMQKVAWCESKYGKELFGDSGHAFSVYQFHKPTFKQWSKELGEELDYNSYHDHIKLAVWAFSKGERYRRAWTSYVAIQNGGEYSFYSKLLKRHFTVYCKL